MEVVASAPGKLMLLGEHAVVYGKPCIVTAVDCRMQVAVEATSDDALKIDAPEVRVFGYTAKVGHLCHDRDMPRPVSFAQTAVKNFYKRFNLSSGLRMQTRSEVPQTYGLGSSSAVTVAAIKALSRLFDIPVTDRALFDLSYATVREVQEGMASGFDVAAAVYGGTLYYIIGGKQIEPLNVVALPLVVGYSGVKADTRTYIEKVRQTREKHPRLVAHVFDAMEILVEKGRKTLECGHLKTLGELMNANQGMLDSLGVNTLELARLVLAARRTGAYGAKLSGAGGGDCMIALVRECDKKSVEGAIQGAGGVVVWVETGAQGVRIESAE